MGELGWDELGYLEYIKDKIRPAPVLVDVGANVGDFTAEWQRRFPGGQARCFEPIEEIFFILNDRFRNNPDVRIYNYGFHSERCRKEIYYVQNSTGMSSIYDRPEQWPRFDVKKVNAEFLTLDTSRYLYLPEDIDYLKIDVEGDELAVLQGGVELLKSGRVHFIQWECGGCWFDSQTRLIDAVKPLDDAGYTTYKPVLHGPTAGGYRIITPDNCPPTFWETGDKSTVVNMLSERREK